MIQFHHGCVCEYKAAYSLDTTFEVQSCVLNEQHIGLCVAETSQSMTACKATHW